MAEFETKAKCPHCGESIYVWFQNGSSGCVSSGPENPVIVTCELSNEDGDLIGGCKKDFAVYPSISIKTTTKKIA